MVKNSVLLVLAVALLATTACRREARNENPDTPPSSVPSAPVVPAPTTTSTTDHAEVFRRAFWRHPTSADRILNAERRVSATESGESWSWFIELHPSPDLLAALRDLETFGLLPLGAPVFNRHPIPPPAWFPAESAIADFEILQSPATGLTVLYHADDNLLFATDQGTGFAPPAR